MKRLTLILIVGVLAWQGHKKDQIRHARWDDEPA